MINRSHILPPSFYRRSEVIQISRELLGTVLRTWHETEEITSGLIVETEAYRSYGDKANHASSGKKTDRNKIMFDEGGVAYVYLCYGIHHLFNVVTNNRDIPDAVLIRAVKPLEGVETMMRRRNFKKNGPDLANGPGKLSQALGIDRSWNGISLQKKPIWIEKGPEPVKQNDIEASTRIGVDYAGEDALLPWRFNLASHKRWTSR